jgi:hypothetical protein
MLIVLDLANLQCRKADRNLRSVDGHGQRSSSRKGLLHLRRFGYIHSKMYVKIDSLVNLRPPSRS